MKFGLGPSWNKIVEELIPKTTGNRAKKQLSDAGKKSR